MGGLRRLRTEKELNSPYGGNLVDLHVAPDRATELKAVSRDFASIDLSPRQLADMEMLATGVFHPGGGDSAVQHRQRHLSYR